MTPADKNDESRSPVPAAAEDEGTGLPGLHSWTALYVFVAFVFAAWVAILYALTRAFS